MQNKHVKRPLNLRDDQECADQDGNRIPLYIVLTGKNNMSKT